MFMKTGSSTASPSSSSSMDIEAPEGSKSTQSAKGCFDDFKDRFFESSEILEITGTDCCNPWKWFGSILVTALQSGAAIFGGTIASLANNSYYAIKTLATGTSYKNEAVSAQGFARRIYDFFTGTIKGSTEESFKEPVKLTRISEEDEVGL
jgi:hypothetical protein